MGSAVFAGQTISYFPVSRIADLYGRKGISYLSIIITFFTLIGLSLSRHLYLSVLIFLFFGISSVGRAIITYVYLVELLPKRYKVIFGTLNLGLTPIVSTLTTAYLRYVGNEMYVVEITAISISFISIFLYYFLPESPLYLYDKR